MPYLNVYLIDKAYGGGEEGGWFYQTGEAIKSLPMTTRLDAERAFRLVSRICDRANNQRRSDIDSVLSEGRFEAVIERLLGVSYPVRRPQYG